MKMKNMSIVLNLILILITISEIFCVKISRISNKNICNTTSCRTAGSLIRASIDPTISPCDDFYEFSCGRWKSANPIPKDKSKFFRIDELTAKLQQTMKKELNKSSLTSDALSVRYAMDFYKACSDQESLENRGYSPLLKVLGIIGGWPLLGARSMYNETKYNWKTSFVYLYAVVGQSAIFDLSVDPDANQTDVNTLYLGVPEFGLGRNQLVNMSANQAVVNAYKKYILQTVLQLGANNDNQTHKQIEELLNFESELAKVSTKQEDMRESKVWYNRFTFNKLNNLTDSRLNWFKLIQNVLRFYSSTELKASDYVIVPDVNYYKGTALLLSKTPKNVIANYIGWTTVRKLAPFTTKKMRDIVFGFEKVSFGIQMAKPLFKYCINSLETYLPFAYSRKFIDNHFSGSAKNEAKILVKYLRRAMKNTLRDNQWLDDITRNKSIEKLDAITDNIGFPDWILSNNELDNYYNLTRIVDKKNAFENLLYLKTNRISNLFIKMYKKVNKTLSWPAYPAMVNAFYDPTGNSITIPAGILSDPFFRSQAPVYVNFGAIGQVIGHEFTHAFDDQGSEFDKNGNLINWWTDCTKRIFKEKTKCFINKMNEMQVTELNITLNGRNTVGEDMSDSGGLKQAYIAYKMYEKQMGTPQRLPYVSNFTPEQLFFISFSNILCGNIRPEALKNEIEYDPHTPNKYRVNGQMTKFKKFTEAFKCGVNSKMNLGSVCDVW